MVLGPPQIITAMPTETLLFAPLSLNLSAARRNGSQHEIGKSADREQGRKGERATREYPRQHRIGAGNQHQPDEERPCAHHKKEQPDNQQGRVKNGPEAGADSAHSEALVVVG